MNNGVAHVLLTQRLESLRKWGTSFFLSHQHYVLNKLQRSDILGKSNGFPGTTHADTTFHCSKLLHKNMQLIWDEPVSTMLKRTDSRLQAGQGHTKRPLTPLCSEFWGQESWVRIQSGENVMDPRKTSSLDFTIAWRMGILMCWRGRSINLSFLPGQIEWWRLVEAASANQCKIYIGTWAYKAGVQVGRSSQKQEGCCQGPCLRWVLVPEHASLWTFSEEDFKGQPIDILGASLVQFQVSQLPALSWSECE